MICEIILQESRSRYEERQKSRDLDISDPSHHGRGHHSSRRHHGDSSHEHGGFQDDDSDRYGDSGHRRASERNYEDRGQRSGSHDTGYHGNRSGSSDEETGPPQLSEGRLRQSDTSVEAGREFGRTYNKEEYQAEGDDDRHSLHGRGFPVPLDTMNGESMSGGGQRSEDARNTFDQFTSSRLETSGSQRDDRGPGVAPGTPERRNVRPGSLSDSPSSTSSETRQDASAAGFRSAHASKPAGNLSEASSLNSPPNVAHAAMKNRMPERYSEDQLLSTFNINGLRVTLYFGDLSKENTDGIVNAANENLEHWGGLAYVLRQARGPTMDEECRSYIKQNGSLKTSEVMHTSGGRDIRSMHILHAAGPMWLSESYRERFSRQLTQTFLNCLNYAEDKLWIRSLAFPYISTGNIIQ